CRGVERPCDGTNYAGLEGGYTASGGFATEEMLGTLVAPLNNGQQFRLRACLSLAESSTGPVLVEFVLANSGNLAQQQVVHQVWVTQKAGWIQRPGCIGHGFLARPCTCSSGSLGRTTRSNAPSAQEVGRNSPRVDQRESRC